MKETHYHKTEPKPSEEDYLNRLAKKAPMPPVLQWSIIGLLAIAAIGGGIWLGARRGSENNNNPQTQKEIQALQTEIATLQKSVGQNTVGVHQAETEETESAIQLRQRMNDITNQLSELQQTIKAGRVDQAEALAKANAALNGKGYNARFVELEQAVTNAVNQAQWARKVADTAVSQVLSLKNAPHQLEIPTAKQNPPANIIK